MDGRWVRHPPSGLPLWEEADSVGQNAVSMAIDKLCTFHSKGYCLIADRGDGTLPILWDRFPSLTEMVARAVEAIGENKYEDTHAVVTQVCKCHLVDPGWGPSKIRESVGCGTLHQVSQVHDILRAAFGM